MNDTAMDDIIKTACAMTRADISARIPMPGGSLEHLKHIVHELQMQAKDTAKRCNDHLAKRPSHSGLVPAVPVLQSVAEDYLICLEDGTRHVMLKRYLKRTFGLTADEYRERWGLPKDYPLVAPSYSRTKSEAAFKLGFGTNDAREKEGRLGHASRESATKARETQTL